MANSGYSGTPLIKKLGIKPNMKLLLINEPEDYLNMMEENISELICKQNELPDLIHLFVKNSKEFEIKMKKLKIIYKKNSRIIIWVSWYKKTSKISTDMTEDIIRNYALKNALVDIKVCAVNELWSGLKLVVPLSKR